MMAVQEALDQKTIVEIQELLDAPPAAKEMHKPTWSRDGIVSLGTVIGPGKEIGIVDASFTFMAEVYSEKSQGGDLTIFGVDKSQAVHERCKALHLVVRGGKYYMGFFDQDLNSSAVSRVGQWDHVAYVYNDETSTQKIYVNGAFVAMSSGKQSYKGEARVLVGKGFTGDWNGQIKNVRLYGTALTEANLRELTGVQMIPLTVKPIQTSEEDEEEELALIMSEDSLKVGSMSAGRELNIMRQDKKLVNPKAGSIFAQSEKSFATIELSQRHATDWSVSEEGVITTAANPNLAIGVQTSSLERAQAALSARANVNGTVKDLTPLLAAVRAHDFSVAGLLLSRGANIDGFGRGQHSRKNPILLAAENNDNDMVSLLCELKADQGVTTQGGLSALHLAAKHENGEDVLETLLYNKANPQARDDQGKTALFNTLGSPGYPPQELLLKLIVSEVERGALPIEEAFTNITDMTLLNRYFEMCDWVKLSDEALDFFFSAKDMRYLYALLQARAGELQLKVSDKPIHKALQWLARYKEKEKDIASENADDCAARAITMGKIAADLFSEATADDLKNLSDDPEFAALVIDKSVMDICKEPRMATVLASQWDYFRAQYRSGILASIASSPITTVLEFDQEDYKKGLGWGDTVMYEITFVDVGNHFKEQDTTPGSTAIYERAFPRVGWRMTKGVGRAKAAVHVGEDPLTWGIGGGYKWIGATTPWEKGWAPSTVEEEAGFSGDSAKKIWRVERGQDMKIGRIRTEAFQTLKAVQETAQKGLTAAADSNAFGGGLGSENQSEMSDMIGGDEFNERKTLDVGFFELTQERWQFWQPNDTISTAVDKKNGVIWFAVNGDWEPLFLFDKTDLDFEPIVTSYKADFTINFGDRPFLYPNKEFEAVAPNKTALDMKNASDKSVVREAVKSKKKEIALRKQEAVFTTSCFGSTWHRFFLFNTWQATYLVLLFCITVRPAVLETRTFSDAESSTIDLLFLAWTGTYLINEVFQYIESGSFSEYFKSTWNQVDVLVLVFVLAGFAIPSRQILTLAILFATVRMLHPLSLSNEQLGLVANTVFGMMSVILSYVFIILIMMFAFGICFVLFLGVQEMTDLVRAGSSRTYDEDESGYDHPLARFLYASFLLCFHGQGLQAVMDEAYNEKAFGLFFLTILFEMCVLLGVMNLIIGVMSSEWGRMMPLSRSQYNLDRLTAASEFKWPSPSGLFPAPLNIFALPFIILPPQPIGPSWGVTFFYFVCFLLEGLCPYRYLLIAADADAVDVMEDVKVDNAKTCFSFLFPIEDARREQIVASWTCASIVFAAAMMIYSGKPYMGISVFLLVPVLTTCWTDSSGAARPSRIRSSIGWRSNLGWLLQVNIMCSFGYMFCLWLLSVEIADYGGWAIYASISCLSHTILSAVLAVTEGRRCGKYHNHQKALSCCLDVSSFAGLAETGPVEFTGDATDQGFEYNIESGERCVMFEELGLDSQKWEVNFDGTISPVARVAGESKRYMGLVLGMGNKNKLALVNHQNMAARFELKMVQDFRRIPVTGLAAPSADERETCPLRLVSHGGGALALAAGETKFMGNDVIRLTNGSEESAVRVIFEQAENDKAAVHIRLAECERLASGPIQAFQVAHDKFEIGSSVIAYYYHRGEGEKFILNEDGTISPAKADKLALGFKYDEQELAPVPYDDTHKNRHLMVTEDTGDTGDTKLPKPMWEHDEEATKFPILIGNPKHYNVYDDSFTFAAWVLHETRTPPSRDRLIFGCNEIDIRAEDPSKAMHCGVRQNRWSMDFAWNNLHSNTSIEQGSWEHVAFVYNKDKRSMQIFVNGALVDSKEQREPYKGESNLFLGGGFPDSIKKHGLNDWIGRIKKAKIYGDALTSAQVRAEAGVKLANLVLKLAPDALRIAVPSKKFFGEEEISTNPDGTITVKSDDSKRFMLLIRGDKQRAMVSVPAEFAPSGSIHGMNMSITRCAVGPATEAVTFYQKGNAKDCVLYLATDPQKKAIEVAHKSMKAGAELFYWNMDPPGTEGSHTRFIFNPDGSITPSPTSPDVKDGDPMLLRLGKKKRTAIQ
jgi:hypothetical protein